MHAIDRSSEYCSASYNSWKQVSGYFDGDGNVGLEVVKRVLKFKLRFVDTWRPQISSVSEFLSTKGINCGSIGKGEKNGAWQAAYRLDVAEVRSVLKAAKAMLSFTVKKNAELQVAIDYLENKITGNQAIRALNEEVLSGRRRGKIRKETLPQTRIEGLRLAQLENARNARAAYAVDVPGDIQEMIRADHSGLKLGHIRLARKYGYSTHVIRRVLAAL